MFSMHLISPEDTLSYNDLSKWNTSEDYRKVSPDFRLSQFLEISDLLLERPNLNSTHLFRADILYDSASKLQTVSEREQSYGINQSSVTEQNLAEHDPPFVAGYALQRTVVRRLIPRKPQLDKPLEQSCYTFVADKAPSTAGRLVIYMPHVKSETEVPWYHPAIKALAYRFEEREQDAVLSVHYIPFSSTDQAPADRLHRTFMSLVNTMIRLMKIDSPKNISSSTENTEVSARSTAPSALKDTILPQHTVQNTYTRLKQTYAKDLMSRWIEKTEPSKHVFEDLSIAAFLIELWKQIYNQDPFPGFVDIACGNGVLVYILIKEGYSGCGFDARRRKTWEILEIDQYIEEKVCIPRPFLDTVSSTSLPPDMAIHDGIFKPGTFIISNHADELTPWTPILAALSNPQSPLPFIAIPCCSHALSGARHRYSPKDIDIASSNNGPSKPNHNDQDPQPPTGDLKALRLQKTKAASHTDDKSQYSCLTKKTVSLAEELGFDVEMTLMRIPSTRNIGVVGNRKHVMDQHDKCFGGDAEGIVKQDDDKEADDVRRRIDVLIDRECTVSGGREMAARIWIERAKKLQGGAGRGKVNLGAKPVVDEHSVGG